MEAKESNLQRYVRYFITSCHISVLVGDLTSWPVWPVVSWPPMVRSVWTLIHLVASSRWLSIATGIRQRITKSSSAIHSSHALRLLMTTFVKSVVSADMQPCTLTVYIQLYSLSHYGSHEQMPFSSLPHSSAASSASTAVLHLSLIHIWRCRRRG